MAAHEDKVRATVADGRRFLSTEDPNKYFYVRRFKDLPGGNRCITVIVRFSMMITADEPTRENNLVRTAYMTVNRPRPRRMR
jgi:hypothetical protein